MKIIHLPASLLLALLPVLEVCSTQEDWRPELKVYPTWQTVIQDGDAVFDCRDEGPLRLQVQWLRGDQLQVSTRGRLIIRRAQVQHAGAYTCRAVDAPRSFAGAEVTASLQVVLHGVPRLRQPHQSCTPMEAQCRNGECVPKEFVCDGEFDCTDGSDERHCKTTTPHPLPAWKPRVAELRAAVACGKDEGPCRNRHCIPVKFFCDGEFDCTDGSDELHCNQTTAKHSASLTHRGTQETTDNEVVTVLRPQWGEWSAWSPCNDLCERGRSRKCRMVQGTACEGPNTEWRKCQMKDCQVDGGWSAWTPWTSCSESCGKGTRRRYRKCDNPAPNYGGSYCSGSDGQQENCVQAACVAGGEWGPWGTWTPCSRTSGGSRVRTRRCEGGGGGNCKGESVEKASCFPCPKSLKIGLKPVRVTVSRGRLVNFTCHYRRRGDETLSLELDLPSIPHSNEVIKSAPEHRIIKDSLTATRCGARRKWTLLLGGGRTLVRCVVRDSQGRVLGKAESKVLAVPSSPGLLCHGDKNCHEHGVTKKKQNKKKPVRKELSPPVKVTKELIKKETYVKPLLRPGSPPRILQVHPSFQLVRQGGSAHIVCLVAGDPPLEVQWRAEGSGAVTSGGFLQLREVRQSDGGKYVCTARNSAGSAHSSASVVVT